MFPSEIRGLHASEREVAYKKMLAEDNRQDSLGLRISAGVSLSEEEIDALMRLLTHRCQAHTKQEVEHSLRSVPYIRSFGIYSRVLLSDPHVGVSYCAGQDYSSEITEVRRLLKGG